MLEFIIHQNLKSQLLKISMQVDYFRRDYCFVQEMRVVVLILGEKGLLLRCVVQWVEVSYAHSFVFGFLLLFLSPINASLHLLLT